MTDDELRAIKARCEAATPGPWDAIRTTDRPQDGAFLIFRNNARNCWTSLMRVVTVVNPKIPSVPPRDEARLARLEDAEFCALARADVPALLTEVERLRSVIRRAYQGDPDDLHAEGERLCGEGGR